MAKRFQLTKKPAKKLKLDVSVNQSYFGTSTSNIEEFWGSDDDDFVLLATQLEEKKQQQSNEDHFKEVGFGFSQLVRQENTSTQQTCGDPATSSRQCPVATSNQHQDINPNEMPKTYPHVSFSPELGEVQKELQTLACSQWTDYPTSQVTANRRQLAQERQLKFLMERADVLKKENIKLQKEITDRNSETVTKDGEVTFLRNELRQARKLLQATKIDKMLIVEEVAKESSKKIDAVFMQVIAENTELSFKNVELNIQRAKNMFKGNTVSTDIRANLRRNMLRMESLHITRPNTKENSAGSDQHLYEISKETCATKKQRSLFEGELEQLLFHFAQLTSQRNNDKAILDHLIVSVCRVLAEFWSYAENLELPQHCIMYPYHHFDLQLDDSASIRHSLIQPDIIYKNERAVILRRYIATLALICQRQSNVSQALLEKNHGNYPILQLVIEAIAKLSYSLDVYKYFGVIEATGAFLNSLLGYSNAAKIPISGSQEDLLFNLLKQLVFSRPSPYAFQELSSCMLLCTRQERLMSRMCIGSTQNNCFVSNRVRSVYRFGPESCLLQVYAGLLELCFCSEMPLQSRHFKLLLSICGNHVRFIYQCFTSMPDFIRKMLPLPSFIDDEKTDECEMSKVVGLQSTTVPSHNDTATVNAPTNISEIPSMEAQDQQSPDQDCECYVKLCLSVVTLVFQMMYQWALQEERADVSEVSEISQIAIHLLVLIFREYYLPNLFRDSEETTKLNLSLLCTWWKDNKEILNFEDTHVHLLKQLQELQFMLKPLHQEANLSNPDNDLVEWTRLVNNSDANIQKYDAPGVQMNVKTLFSHKTTDFFSNLQTSSYNFE